MPNEVTVHLARGYESGTTRVLLATFGFAGEIARKGVPAPVQAGKRWVVDFYLYLAAAFVVVRRLIRQARVRYRWDMRPTPKRLK